MQPVLSGSYPDLQKTRPRRNSPRSRRPRSKREGKRYWCWRRRWFRWKWRDRRKTLWCRGGWRRSRREILCCEASPRRSMLRQGDTLASFGKWHAVREKIIRPSPIETAYHDLRVTIIRRDETPPGLKYPKFPRVMEPNLLRVDACQTPQI